MPAKRNRTNESIPAVLLMFILGALLSACGMAPAGTIDPAATAPPQLAQATVVPDPNPRTDISIGEITRNPAAYVGQTVLLQGEISEALSPQSFRMTQEWLFPATQILVVYAADTRGVTMIDGQPIEVTGVVQTLEENANEAVILATRVQSHDRAEGPAVKREM